MELENSLVAFSVTRGPIRGKDRNRIGITVKVKAHRDVEDFMSAVGHGRKSAVEMMGDMWQNSVPDGKPLMFYDSEQRFDAQSLYTLEHVGNAPLISVGGGERLRALGEPPSNRELVNLAFLRLAGISEGDGVSVGIAGAYSFDYIKRLKTSLPRAVEQFLRDYVVPITINLQILSKG
jgi:hypothetical protein